MGCVFAIHLRGVQLLCIIESVMLKHHHLVSSISIPIDVCVMVAGQSRMANDGL